MSEIPPKSFFDSVHKVGGIINIMRKGENYILVTNKRKTIYFELASPEPLYYPYVIMNKLDCRINPKSILPPKRYNLYNKI